MIKTREALASALASIGMAEPELIFATRWILVVQLDPSVAVHRDGLEEELSAFIENAALLKCGLLAIEDMTQAAQALLARLRSIADLYSIVNPSRTPFVSAVVRTIASSMCWA